MIESFKLPNIIPETLTGSICSFNDEYGNLPLKSCVSQISGYQEGSGVPSPDNVRPLHAWSSASLGKCDNNTASLWSIDNSFNGDVEFNQLLENGDFSNGTTGWAGLDSVVDGVAISTTRTRYQTIYQAKSIVIGHKYLFSSNLTANSSRTLAFAIYDSTTAKKVEQFNVVQNVFSDVEMIIDTSDITGGSRLCVANWSSGDTVISMTRFMVIDLTQMFGSTIADYIYNLETQTAGAGVAFFKALYPNDYYPYNAGTKQLVGDTLATFTFGQSIYQGSIDWKRGVVVGTHLLLDLGSKSYTRGKRNYEDTAYIFYFIFTVAKIGTSVECEQFNYVANVGAWENLHINEVTHSSSVIVMAADYSLPDDIKTAMNGVMLAYELKTPIEIPLGGINLLTQQGVNNIFCDTGDTTLEWLKVN